MDLEKWTKIFILDRKDYEVLEYRYIKKYKGGDGRTYHTIETLGGYKEEMLDSVFNHSFFGFRLSKIVALSEMEEYIREKLDKVHSQMKKHKIDYLAVDEDVT